VPKLPDFIHSRRDADDTRRKIMETTRRLMAEYGPDVVTISKVAREAGINRATAYEHFHHRDSLIGTVMADVAEQASEIFKVDLPPNTLVDYIIGYFARKPDICRLWMYQTLAQAPLPNRKGSERYFRAMHAFARSPIARKGIDAEMLGEIVLSAMLVWSLRVKRRETSRTAERLLTLRFAREMKRLLLYGAIKPSKSREMVGSARGKIVNDVLSRAPKR